MTKSPQGDRQLPLCEKAWPIGCKVTLRGPRMYEFLDRLISLALPRVRDFRGLNPKAFDGHGNYSLGLSEQLVFPELNPDKFLRPQGMNMTLVISGTKSDDESRELLRGFGMPFKTERSRRQSRRGIRLARIKTVRRTLTRPATKHTYVSSTGRKRAWQVNRRLPRPKQTPKFTTRLVRRCKICGRPRAVYRKFGICRICFRKLADEGLIPGVKKASW